MENDFTEKILKVLNIINIYTGEGEANCEILILEKEKKSSKKSQNLRFCTISENFGFRSRQTTVFGMENRQNIP